MAMLFPPTARAGAKVMVFVDGENLAIRFKNKLQELKIDDPQPHVAFQPDVFVWSTHLNMLGFTTELIRKYYYTSIQGDTHTVEAIEERLKSIGIECPRVFKKPKGTRGSKRVDITLATDMLTHAFRKNFDIAILVAGDEDYVPLVEAVISEGRRVYLWFIENGLSPLLKRKADHYCDIGEVLFFD